MTAIYVQVMVISQCIKFTMPLCMKNIKSLVGHVSATSLFVLAWWIFVILTSDGHGFIHWLAKPNTIAAFTQSLICNLVYVSELSISYQNRKI